MTFLDNFKGGGCHWSHPFSILIIFESYRFGKNNKKVIDLIQSLVLIVLTYILDQSKYWKVIWAIIMYRAYTLGKNY